MNVVQEWTGYMVQVLAIVHAIMVVGFTIRILLRDDLSSVARLAWFLVLLLAPYFGVVVYLLFGEISLGRSIHSRHDEIFQRLHQIAASILGSCDDNLPRKVEIELQAAFRAASVDGFETTIGNSGELLANDQVARSRMIKDFDNASESIQCLYYIWLDDHTGKSVAAALIRAAQRGVTCHAMADGLGSRRFIGSAHWRQMREAGVNLEVALPIDPVFKTILFSRLDLRNHRKITVIDNRITYCGSQNCADPEFLVKAKYAPWVDIMLRLEGPIAKQKQLLFASDWLLSSRDEIPSSLKSPWRTVDGGFAAQVFADGPTERRGATPQLFATLLAIAREEVVITTPYFVPNQTVLDALCSAAARGVEVALVVPQRNDSWIVAAASRANYRRLLEHGVKIYEFCNGLLHAKTFTLDRKISLVGSTNLDLRSFDLNYENDVILRDDKLTGDIHARQLDYVCQSNRVTLNEVRQWSYARRIWNNVIATVGPIL